MPFWVFILSLICYFALHSTLAAASVKTWLTKVIPPHFYRLFYNGLAVLLLFPLFWMYDRLQKEVLFDENSLSKISGWSLTVVGLALIVAALKSYDLGEFSGLRQLKQRTIEAHTTLNVKGLNAWLRHPLYVGTFLVAWGIFLIEPTIDLLVTVVISTVYLYVGSRLEERKLTQQFGEAYRSYQAKVKF